MRPKDDLSSAMMIIGIPLAVIDTFFGIWICRNCINTTKTLKLKGNKINFDQSVPKSQQQLEFSQYIIFHFFSSQLRKARRALRNK